MRFFKNKKIWRCLAVLLVVSVVFGMLRVAPARAATISKTLNTTYTIKGVKCDVTVTVYLRDHPTNKTSSFYWAEIKFGENHPILEAVQNWIAMVYVTSEDGRYTEASPGSLTLGGTTSKSSEEEFKGRRLNGIVRIELRAINVSSAYDLISFKYDDTKTVARVAKKDATTSKWVWELPSSPTSTANKKFKGWSKSVSSYSAFPESGTLKTLSSKTAYAFYDEKATVSFHANGGSGTPPANIAYSNETSYTFPDAGSLSKSGCTFEGWGTTQDALATGGTVYKPGASLSLSPVADVTYYAQWSKHHTLSYNMGDSGVSAPSSTSWVADADDSAEATAAGAVARPGYEFLGWSRSENSSTVDVPAGGTLTLTQDTVLYPVWNEKVYTATFDANGAQNPPAIEDASGTLAEGGIDLPSLDLKKPNYKFLGWSTNASESGTGTVYTDRFPISASTAATTTLYAVWKQADSYELTFAEGPADMTGSLPPGGTYVGDGISDTVTLPVVNLTRPGYTFEGWSTSSGGPVVYDNTGKSFTITGDTTLYTVWREEKHTLRYEFNGDTDSMIGSKPADVTAGPSATNIHVAGQGTMAREYHKFTGWEDASGKAYAVGSQVQLTSDITLYAQWKDLRQTLSPDDPDNPNPGGGEARTGEAFLSYNSNVTGAEIVTNMPSDEGGHYDDNVHNTATVSSLKPVRLGYEFKGWSENASESPSSSSLIKGGAQLSVTADKTLYAIWEPFSQWMVTYTGETLGVTGDFPTDSGGPYYDDGSTHTITVQDNAQTRPGYTFLGWSTTAGSLTADPAYAPGKTFTLTGNITLYAVWSKDVYRITFDGNGYETGTVPDIIQSSYGESATLPAPDLKRRGFVFDGWSGSVDGALDYAAGSALTIDNTISNPLTLYAHWKAADSYTLTYDKNAGSDTVTGSLPGTASYTADGITNVLNVTNVVPVRAGYSFLGWSGTPNGNVEYAAGAPITLSKNTTLYAKWDMGSFSLTYHFNGGSDPMIGTKPATVTGDPTTTGITVAEQGTMAREYHKFIGWKDDSGKDYNVGDPITLTSNINLYAQWKDLRQTLPPDDPDNPNPGGGEARTGETFLSYNSNVTGAEIVTNMPADEGGYYNDDVHNMATISAQKPVRLGYEFKGWSENASESPSSTALLQGGAELSMITDKTLYAIWELKDYTLTYDENVPSGDPAPITGTFPSSSVKGNVATSINTDNASGFSRNHYTFKEWNTQANGTGTSYAAGASITLSADTTLYAIWDADSYTVTYDGGGATGTPPGTQTGKYGASFVAEQPANLTNPGKSFAGWKDGNGNTYSPGASYPFEGNLKLTAQWATDIWTIQYNISSAEQGAAIADATATLGDTVVLPTGVHLKKSRSVFKGWNTAPDGSTGTAYPKGGSFTIAESTPKTTILYASWESAASYKVTYHKNASDATGTEPPAATCYNDGLAETTVVPADSLTRKGYTFMGWSTSSVPGAAVEYRAGDTVEPVKAGKDMDLYAVWGMDSFTLTYDKGNSGAIGTAPATVTGNAESNLTAEPQGSLYLARHKFVGWNTEADYSGASIKPGERIVLNENKTLYAQWTPVSAMSVTYYSGCTDPAIDATLPVDTNQYYDDGINSRATISTMKPLRPGYDFLYWTTQPNGAGKQYNGGETVTMTGDLKLYATWDMGSYSLTYDPGESPSEVQGSMPASKFGNLLSKITVEDDTGFSRPYYTFSGWNTAKDGAGTTYQPGDKISLGMDTVLYAQWKETTYKVKYDLNSPLISTATGTIPSAISGTYQDKFRAAPQGDIICPKYRFMGWDTDPDGVGDRFDPGKEYSFGVFEDYGDDVTLYAVWEAVPPYEVVYDKNSTKVTGSVPVDKNLYTVDDGNNLATVLGPGSLKWKGYEFVCWSTKKNGSGSKYVEGSQFRVTAHTKLYAQWTPGTYTLTYDKNGSEVKGKVPASIRKSSQEDITAAGKGTLTRKNYEFLGWAPKADAVRAVYKAGAKFRIVEDTKLYAVWRKLVNVSMEETEGLVPGSSVAVQQVSPGTKLSEIRLPQVKGGYEITGWIVNGETITNPENYEITKDSNVQPIVEKKPDDNKGDGDKKPDGSDGDKKPGGGSGDGGDKKPGGGSGTGGNNPGGGGDSGGNNFGDGDGSGGTRGNNSGSDGGVGNGAGSSNDGAGLDNSSKRSLFSVGDDNGDDQSFAARSGYVEGQGDGYGSGFGSDSGSGSDNKDGSFSFLGCLRRIMSREAEDCIYHWIILLCMLLHILYLIWRKRHIEKECLLRTSVPADLCLSLISVPLGIAAICLLPLCRICLVFLIVWVFCSIAAIGIFRRAVTKNQNQVAQEYPVE